MKDDANEFESKVGDSNTFLTGFTPPDLQNIDPEAPAEQQHDGRVQIQVMVGAPQIKIGHIALVLRNIPILPITLPDGEVVLTPCVQLNARQAMEIAMNLIHIAKIAESQSDI